MPHELVEEVLCRIALMTDDVSRLPYLKWLSNTCVRTIRGAITLSMCINFVAVSLSVMGVLNPVTGALVHNCGSCFVVLLAALLYDRKYPGTGPSGAPDAVSGREVAVQTA